MVTLKFKSLEEVNSSASNLPDLSKQNHEAISKSIRKLLEEGTKEYERKERENAYFHIFRSFEMLNRLKRNRAFKREEEKIYGIIGGKNKLRNAMNILEELKESLLKDYASLRSPLPAKAQAKHLPIKKELSLRHKMTVGELMSLKEKGQKDFLLCEVRSEEDYLDNHVSWPESLLVPPGVIQPGIIPKNLEGRLPASSRSLFTARCEKDYIIFMDAHSEALEDSETLKSFKQILTEWEVGHVRHNIIICEGGFDKFSMAYPLHTTKKMKSTGAKSGNKVLVDIRNLSYPEVEKPPQKNAKSPAFSSGAISLSPTTANGGLDTQPNTFEYPDEAKGTDFKPYGSDRSLITTPKAVEYPDEAKGTDFKPYVPDRSLKAHIITDPSKGKPSEGTKKDEGVYPSIVVEKETELPLKPPPVECKETKEEDESGMRQYNPNTSSSTINRSYSSPNIAELAEKEDSPCSIIPRIHVDRSTKPSSQIKRNFDHIWSSGQTKRGLTGLKNLGNTCYMNSILQCISNFTVMAKYFLEKKYINDINKKSETKGHIANEYSALLQQMWSGNVKSISPSDMKRVIGRYNSNFSGFDQQDAHEFFLSFMLWLHNDVNEIQNKVALPEQKTENASSKKAAAKKAWDHELRIDKSFIRQTFYGQRKSTLQCLACNYESSRYDSFIELSLELPPGNRKVSLGECIKLYLDPVYVTWTCSQCKHNGRSLKKFDLVKLPLILTIHLARFFNDGLWRKKQNVVEFDLEHVNFGRYVTHSEEGALNTLSDFSLYGVCNHFGSMEGGHYTAYCYSQVYSKWHKYDDNEVHEIDRSSVVTPAAYVLFYAAKN